MADITSYDELVAVERSNTGAYAIPGAAEPEDPTTVASDMSHIEDYGELMGWDPWQRVYRCTDESGAEHWYFARSR